MMVDWLGHEAANVPMIEKWLAVQGLTLADYLAHLKNAGTSDDLELWAFSLATNKAVMIVQESSVWLTSIQGVDFEQITIAMTTYTSGQLCSEEHSDDDSLPIAVPLDSQDSRLKRSGRPFVMPQEPPSSSSDELTTATSTDLEELMEAEYVLTLPMPKSGQLKPRVCPVCVEELTSGLALERYMRHQHPLVKPFQCSACTGAFNSHRDLSSHVANLHRWCKVTCKHCEYHTVSKSRMRLHVCVHTHGLHCDRCKKSFPSQVTLHAHLKHHPQNRPTYDCDLCDRTYATALCIHHHRKHGVGFPCEHCNRCFDTPAQQL